MIEHRLAGVAPAGGAGRLVEFFRRHRRILVLTGAGCSTDSGIPDYRDADGTWKRPRPIMYGDFIRDPAARRAYWARSVAGWPRFAAAAPNPAHRALAGLEARGHVQHVVTQNVDGLHQRAGSRGVTDLHGRLDAVRCLGCGRRRPRDEFQRELLDRNPGWGAAGRPAPDGDAEITEADHHRFAVPACWQCGGLLKPDVVFFGEAVPPDCVGTAMSQLDAAGGLLVVGSSLMVFSGFRLAREAARAGKPVAAINLGATRADGLLALKVHDPCAPVLTELLARLDD